MRSSALLLLVAASCNRDPLPPVDDGGPNLGDLGGPDAAPGVDLQVTDGGGDLARGDLSGDLLPTSVCPALWFDITSFPVGVPAIAAMDVAGSMTVEAWFRPDQP